MIVLEVSDDMLVFKDDFNKSGIKVLIAKPKSFSGVDSLTQIAIVAIPAITSALAIIIAKMLESKKSNSIIKIKCDGVEIEGLTEENTLIVLEKLLAEKYGGKETVHDE